jgi:microcystin-dependent protein
MKKNLEELPIGAIIPTFFAPDGVMWKYCDGSSLFVANYTKLFAVIGYTYGGAGASFNLPDCRGRVSTMKQTVATAPAGIFSPNSATLGATGGTETAVADYPSHDHGGIGSTSVVNLTHYHTAYYVKDPNLFFPSGDYGYGPWGSFGENPYPTRQTDIGHSHPTSTSTNSSTTGTSGAAHSNVGLLCITNKIVRVL